MAFQTVFKRYELKYMLTCEQKKNVLVELKKKYKHVVYKRRISLPEVEAIKWLSGEKQPCNPDGINFIFNLCNFLQIHRKVFAEEHLFYSYAQGATVHQCRKDAP